MEFNYNPVESLPPLAWCATLRRNQRGVTVHHGSQIETDPSFFVEGAWDGAFEAGRFDTALTFTGSGGRIEGNQVCFSSASNNLERLYALKTDAALYIANSLVLLFHQTGESLDATYPDYFLDYTRFHRTGLRSLHKSIPCASGRRVQFLDCCNLTVGPDLGSQIRLRDFGRPHKDFEAYHALLDHTVQAVFANAADSSRWQQYRPLAAISRGYDSPAVAAVAVRNGCIESFSFFESSTKDNDTYVMADDNGSEIAGILGMSCKSYHRMANTEATRLQLIENFENIFACPMLAITRFQQDLPGRMLLTGRHGEHFWNLDPYRSLPWYQEITARAMPGVPGLEFRLANGFINFHAPYIGGVHAPSLLKISRSKEMAPWRIGGNYDRPIARRIVENAGVGREQFGQVKMGGDVPIRENRELPAAVNAEFLDYYRHTVPCEVRKRLETDYNSIPRFFNRGRPTGLDKRLRAQYGLRGISERLLGHRGNPRVGSAHLYTFHWAFNEMIKIYRDKAGQLVA